MSQQRFKLVIESSLVSSSLRSTALYSASLLEPTNVIITASAMVKPSGDLRTMLTPPPVALDESSVSKTHNMAPRSWSYKFYRSTINSTRTFPLIADLERYSMSNSINSIAHFKSLPDAFGLWSMALIG